MTKCLYIRNMPDLSEEELRGLREALAQYAILRKAAGRRSGSLQRLLSSFLAAKYENGIRPIPTVAEDYQKGDIEYRIEDGSFRHPVRDPPIRNRIPEEEYQQQEAAIAADQIRRNH
jgi:hypothetical protein